MDEENKSIDNNLVSAGSSSDGPADTSLQSSVHGDKKEKNKLYTCSIRQCTHDGKNTEIPPSSTAHQRMGDEQLPTVLQFQVKETAANVLGNVVSREIKQVGYFEK